MVQTGLHRRRHIALVTNAFGGGVWTVVRFLQRVIAQSDEFDADVITLAFSACDADSVRITSPATWLRGPRVSDQDLDGCRTRHVGAVLTEFELQRYKPRRVLTDLLNTYDLVQLVGGSAAAGQAVSGAARPLCLFAATTAEAERTAQAEPNHLLRFWRSQMTRFAARAEKNALAAADIVFAESDYTRQLLAGKTRAGALRLGPPGVDAAFFRPRAVLSLDGPILCVGRFHDSRKNVRLLLEAYSGLSRRRALPPLHLVGRGGVNQVDWRFAEGAGIADRVRIFRDVSMQQLRDLYQASSLFVLPSNEEGLGIVILEAMASGLPVISTDCGGPTTAIVPDETGLLTPVGDAGALADAMCTLLNNPGRRIDMGAAGRRRVEELFTIERAGAVYLNAYRELLAIHRQSGPRT